MKACKYCIYVHRKATDGGIFYVGKAQFCEKRGRFVRPYTSSHRSAFWSSIVSRHGFTVEIVSKHESKSEADIEEKRLISLFGKRITGNGILCNLADGGEGNSGAPRTLVWKERIRVAHLGKKLSNEHKEKLRLAHQGKSLSVDHRKAISIASKRLLNFRLNDPEVRRKSQENRAGVKAKQRSREHQDKINAANLGSKRSAEARLKMSIAAKKRWQNSLPN